MTYTGEEWERTFDAVPDMMMILDSQYTILRVNKATVRRLEISPEKVMGSNCYKSFCGSDRPPPLCPHKRLLADGQEHFEEIYNEQLGGYFIVSVSPIHDTHGQVTGSVHVARDITDRKHAEEKLQKREVELKLKTHRLKEANTALKVLLSQIEGDRKELEENILANVKKQILPYLEKLKKSQLDTDQIIYVDLLESSIKSIISPLIKKLSSPNLDLTPAEIRVAGLIKDGKTTKEIAEYLGLSENTILSHRYNLRSKLGLKKGKTNLRSYLQSLSE